VSLSNDGGPFVVWIFASGVLMWALIVERYWYFARILPKQAAQLQAEWLARTDRTSWCARQIRTAMISKLNQSMTTGFPVLQVLVPMSPLLGLIGTVSGMLEVFDSMALRGNADARSMASGVSAAMICTMTGLAVSITGLYPVHYFRTRARRETELLADKLSF
jgi:biopolymer transport protein ExbB